MPNWKKVIVSGSDAILNQVTIPGNLGTTTFTTNADTLIFSGSAYFTGSTVITGSLSATSITGSLSGTASYANNATTASYALTASFTPNSTSGSYALSASYADSASFASTASYVSSNFQYEVHVSQVDGNDTTGNGDLLKPVASITKAL